MDVYVLKLDTLRPRREEAIALLSPARREKIDRLLREEPRLQNIGAGLLLRRFFGDADPLTAPGGKPYYPGGREFNLTHSGEVAAIALGEVPVGLDAERIRTVSPAVIKRVLDEEEQRWLSRQGEDGFAFLWTRKEAALKCLGTGVDRKLASFCVLPGKPLVLDDTALSLYSVQYGEYVLSAACTGDASFTPRILDAEELLKGI